MCKTIDANNKFVLYYRLGNDKKACEYCNFKDMCELNLL